MLAWTAACEYVCMCVHGGGGTERERKGRGPGIRGGGNTNSNSLRSILRPEVYRAILGIVVPGAALHLPPPEDLVPRCRCHPASQSGKRGETNLLTSSDSWFYFPSCGNMNRGEMWVQWETDRVSHRAPSCPRVCLSPAPTGLYIRSTTVTLTV